MNALASELRKQLGKAVLLARDAAETGARKALEELAVHEPEPYKHLNEEQRLLRRALRAQARQLGDEESRTKKGAYEVTHLAEKVAYDQWHRLLFARFLLENNLLLSPEHGVAVAFADCEELAPALGLRDGWAVAARFAAAELPEIFRADDAAGRLELPVEDRKQLVQLVTGLPIGVFLADDSLGWVYQFWQAKRKEEVNSSGKKIGADELAPVTQLFTEDYMVLFLFHNTLGAWRAGKVLRNADGGTRNDLPAFASEEDVRRFCALPGVNWEYLRFVRSETPSPLEGESQGKVGSSKSAIRSPQSEMRSWLPAAGTFDGWPKTSQELRLLDPCMGSGHFLVALLLILVALRMAEEGLTKEEAVVAVLRDNLFGLELDPRCAQIAAFNLALAAWKLAGWQRLPPLNLACSGLAPRTKLETWTALACDNQKVRAGMERLYQLFKDAPTLGSLIDPRKLGGDLLTAEFHELQPLLQRALEREATRGDETAHELAVTAQGLAHAAEILAGQFTLVATNVPYLGRSKQDDSLKAYCERHHPDAKADLATCFVERCLDFCAHDGTTALVTLQNWLFYDGYTELRVRLLKNAAWGFVARLGPKGFQTPMWDFNVMLVCITSSRPSEQKVYFGVDLSDESSPAAKDYGLHAKELIHVSQAAQLRNADARIGLTGGAIQTLLGQFVELGKGSVTGDGQRHLRKFWEPIRVNGHWRPWLDTPQRGKPFSGRESIVFWRKDGEDVKREKGAWLRGQNVFGKRGVLINKTTLDWAVFTGEMFDDNTGVLIPLEQANIPAVLGFITDEGFPAAVKAVDQALKVTIGSFGKIPIDLAYWQVVGAEKYRNGMPKPFSSDPTQWLFNGHPKGADHPLQVAVARLLGYRWPRQTGSSFPDCPALGPDGLEQFADADGIVCLSAIRGDQPATDRLHALLAAAYGQEWSAAKQAELLAQVGFAGKTVEDWLRSGFFEQHCALFHHRPFVWHIWDGRKDGFSALVNYHQLTKANLEKLTYAYLGDWIRRQQAAVDAGEAGSDARLLAAKQLQGELQKILDGEGYPAQGAGYDIFIRWKPLEQQPIGWEPVLNDGVRLNIGPFMSAQDVGKKGAGILRSKPNIHWNKDRGTDVTSAPWFKVFKGERINDHHLTVEEKRKTREGKGPSA
jgi:hypothetical protein